jgi:hypothetical protein
MDLTRAKSELLLENMLLRQQLIVLKRQAKRPALTWRDRKLFVLLASRLRTWKQALLILSERHLHRVMKEYGEYFDHARPHQGLGQRIPFGLLQGAEPLESRQIASRPILSGLHHDYQWREAEGVSYP